MMKRSLFKLALLVLMAPALSWALQAVSDDDLAGVSGQSGFTMLVTTNPTTFTSGIGDNDSGSPTMVHINPGYGTASSADLLVTGYEVLPIGEAGAAASSPLNLTISADTGADSSGAGFGLAVTWTRMRTQYSYLSLCSGDYTACPQRTSALGTSPATAQAFGELVTDNPGQFTLASSKGLFDTTTLDPNRLLRLTIGPYSGGVGTTNAYLTALNAYQTTAGYGQLYYGQAVGGATPSAELLLDNITLDAGIHPGSGGVFGVCTNTGTCGYTNNKFQPNTTVGGVTVTQPNYSGMYFVTPQLDFNMTFSFDYLGNPSSAFTSSTTANNYISNSTNCASTTASPVCNLAVWGWSGDFSGTGGSTNSGAGLLIGGGGAWTAPTATGTYSPDTPANRGDGINIAFRGNFDPTNFTWYVGRAGGVLAFGNWTTFNGAPWSLNAPNITLDVVNASQGPGGLCWGASVYGGSTACTSGTHTIPNLGTASSPYTVSGQFLDTYKSGSGCTASPCNAVTGSSAEPALGLFIRDLSLQAYSTQVQILDDVNDSGSFYDGASATPCVGSSRTSCDTVTTTKGTAAKAITEPWTLMYTFGQLDANIYLYPGNGGTTAGSTGLTTDILLMTQSFGAASNSNPMLGNSNFMIGETCTAGTNCNIPSGTTWCNPSCTLAVGFTSASLLFAANQLHLNLNGNSTTYSNFFNNPAGATPPTFGPGIEFKTNDFRDEISGLFSGGLVVGCTSGTSTCTSTVNMAQPGTYTAAATAGQNEVVQSYWDINIESTSTDITFSPQLTTYSNPNSTGNKYSYIGLAGHITFASPGAPNNETNVGGTAPTSATSIQLTPSGSAACGSSNTNWYAVCNSSYDGTYVSLAEPTQPTSYIRFADIQGDVTILPCSSSVTTGCTTGGGTLTSPTPSQVFLISGGDPSFPNDTNARLRIAETTVLGASPGGTIGTGAEPLSAIVKFGTSPLGTIVIPSAQIYTSITLRPQ